MKTAKKKSLDTGSDSMPTLLQGKSPERISAELGLSPVFANSQTSSLFADNLLREGVPRGEAITVMAHTAEKVKQGDLSECEATLAAQAVSLDAIFNALARKAAANLDSHLAAAETCLRLALKAQGQCRATVQTLAEIKNPRPVAFVKQANIAHGPQQVNNGMPADRCPSAHAREENQIRSNELLERQHEQRLDTRAARAPGRNDPQLETVGTRHRTKDKGRQGH